MNNCPICNTPLSSGAFCKTCGFDTSCDYERYGSVSRPKTVPASIAARRAAWQGLPLPVYVPVSVPVEAAQGEDAARWFDRCILLLLFFAAFPLIISYGSLSGFSLTVLASSVPFLAAMALQLGIGIYLCFSRDRAAKIAFLAGLVVYGVVVPGADIALKQASLSLEQLWSSRYAEGLRSCLCCYLVCVGCCFLLAWLNEKQNGESPRTGRGLLLALYPMLVPAGWFTWFLENTVLTPDILPAIYLGLWAAISFWRGRKPEKKLPATLGVLVTLAAFVIYALGYYYDTPATTAAYIGVSVGAAAIAYGLLMLKKWLFRRQINIAWPLVAAVPVVRVAVLVFAYIILFMYGNLAIPDGILYGLLVYIVLHASGITALLSVAALLAGDVFLRYVFLSSFSTLYYAILAVGLPALTVVLRKTVRTDRLRLCLASLGVFVLYTVYSYINGDTVSVYPLISEAITVFLLELGRKWKGERWNRILPAIFVLLAALAMVGFLVYFLGR